MRLVVGVGCTRGAPAAFVERCIESALRDHGRTLRDVGVLATIEHKRGEPWLSELCGTHDWRCMLFAPDDLEKAAEEGSARVQREVGARAVAEPAARLAGDGALLVAKQTFRDPASGHAVTVAIARAEPADG